MKRLLLVVAAGAACGPEPKLSVIQREVFTQSCTFSSCHGSPYAPSRLDLRAGKSYAALVGQPAEHDPSLILVVPYDPDASYLVAKLEGRRIETGLPHEGHSDIMPPADTGTLAEEWKAAVREWVKRGAKDD